jgi:hypothetical protein
MSTHFHPVAVLTIVVSALSFAPVSSDAAQTSPVGFEANGGQAPADVRFLSRGRGWEMALARDGFRLHLPAPATAVAMTFLGARPAVAVEGIRPLAARTNLYLGSDPAQWRTGLRHYGAVAYRGVYPGIDVVFYGNGPDVEYDVRVAPGADPARFGLAIDAAGRPRISDAGELLIPLGTGELRQPPPRAYQEVAGSRRPVAARYVVEGSRVSFALGAYDHGRTLVIDPVLSFATYLGGVRYDAGEAVAVDLRGNIYLAGASVPGDTVRSVMIAKFDPTGRTLIYESLLGTIFLPQEGFGLAVDAMGNAYVTGYTRSFDPGNGRPGFPTTPGAFQARYGGGAQDAFVAKLNPSGGLVYSTYIGGSGSEAGRAIAVDLAGNAYIAGWTDSADFPLRTPLQPTIGGDRDAFVLKLDPKGAALVYSTFLGGADVDEANGIALDPLGRPTVVGHTRSDGSTGTPFPSLRPLQAAHGGSDDAFVARLSATGQALLFSTLLGGSGDDVATGVALRSFEPYVTGTTTSTDLPRVGASLGTGPGASGEPVGFLTRLRMDGGRVLFSSFVDENGGNAVALDAAGNVYLTGGGVLAARVRATLTGYDYTFGGPPGQGVAADRFGSAVVTGKFFGDLLPTTPGAHQMQFGGHDNARAQDDAFLVKIGPGPRPAPRHEENDPAVLYSGDWQLSTASDFSRGRARRSMEVGAVAAVRFEGTGLRILTRRCPMGGQARIVIDGQDSGTVDTFASPTEPLAVLVSLNGLPAGSHTVEIEVTGTKNPRSSGTWVTFDGFDVVAPDPNLK